MPVFQKASRRRCVLRAGKAAEQDTNDTKSELHQAVGDAIAHDRAQHQQWRKP